MKKIALYVVVFAGLTAFTACHNTKEVAKETVEEVVEEKAPIYKNVSAEEFKDLLTSNPGTLVDVRTANEYSGGYISGARNIDYYSSTFKDEMSTLDKTKPVYVYCRSGNRSGKAMVILQDLGFNEVYNLIGGYSAWPYKANSNPSNPTSPSNPKKHQKYPLKTK